jgi:hypothetical protein
MGANELPQAKGRVEKPEKGVHQLAGAVFAKI